MTIAVKGGLNGNKGQKEVREDILEKSFFLILSTILGVRYGLVFLPNKQNVSSPTDPVKIQAGSNSTRAYRFDENT